MIVAGQTSPHKMPIQEDKSIDKSFIALTDLSIGTVVKLSATGVEPVSSVSDVPFGIVSVGGKVGDRVTIITQFSSIVTSSIADGNIVTGQELTVTDYNATTKVTKFAVATSNQYVIGIALSDALDTAEVTVGMLRSFHKK